MLQVSDIHLAPGYTEQDLRRKLNQCRIPASADVEILKLSLDARKKQEIHYLCTAGASFPGEAAFLKKNKNASIRRAELPRYELPKAGSQPMKYRPVIIGAGPAGLFAGKLLSDAGYAPILLERGAPVEERTKDVRQFWKDGRLKPDSNVQFGEGGAGTFSDGKLNTQVKDRFGRIRKVLTEFVACGADPQILYWNKPHIGTDVLVRVVRNLREAIIASGGEVHFHAHVTEMGIRDGVLTSITYLDEEGQMQTIPTESVILAVGHSAEIPSRNSTAREFLCARSLWLSESASNIRKA